MKVGLLEASRLTGKNKGQIWKARQSGKISAAPDDHGIMMYEVSELERYFGPLIAPSSEGKSEQKPEAPAQDARMKMELEFALKELEMERLRAEDLREERDRWRSVAETALRALPAPAAHPVEISVKSQASVPKRRFLGLLPPRVAALSPE